jgi:hypothetical protein
VPATGSPSLHRVAANCHWTARVRKMKRESSPPARLIVRRSTQQASPRTTSSLTPSKTRNRPRTGARYLHSCPRRGASAASKSTAHRRPQAPSASTSSSRSPARTSGSPSSSAKPRTPSQATTPGRPAVSGRARRLSFRTAAPSSTTRRRIYSR